MTRTKKFLIGATVIAMAAVAYAQTATRFAAIRLNAGTTSLAPLNIPQGVAPTVPANGDIWITAAGLFTRINGGTVGPLGAGLAQSSQDVTIHWSTGFTVQQDQIWRMVTTGNVVNVRMTQAVSGTSNSTSTNSTNNDIPAGLRPTVDTWINIIRGSDNGNAVNVCFDITTTGQVFASMRDTTGTDVICGATTGTWTSSGTKQIKIEAQNGPSNFSYLLN